MYIQKKWKWTITIGQIIFILAHGDGELHVKLKSLWSSIGYIGYVTPANTIPLVTVRLNIDWFHVGCICIFLQLRSSDQMIVHWWLIGHTIFVSLHDSMPLQCNIHGNDWLHVRVWFWKSEFALTSNKITWDWTVNCVRFESIMMVVTNCWYIKKCWEGDMFNR